jgi:hypothetical protein
MVGQFLTELVKLHASRAATIGAYAGSLRKIAADIAGIPSGGKGGKPENHALWRTKVEALKLSLLTPGKIQKWREDFVVRAGTDPVKIRSTRVSVNTFLREARSLFSPRYIEKLDTIVLPDLLPFSGIKLEKRSMPRYQSGFNVSTLVQAACDELAVSQPEQFKVFVLAVMSSLRRNEIDKLEWPGSIGPQARSLLSQRRFSGPKAKRVYVPSGSLHRCLSYSGAITPNRIASL